MASNATGSSSNQRSPRRVRVPRDPLRASQNATRDGYPAKSDYTKMREQVAAALLAICVLLTVLLIKEDRAVPGNYTGWGGPNMTGVTACWCSG